MLLIIKHHNSKEPISGAAERPCPRRTAHHTLTDPLLCWLWLCRGMAAWLEKGSTAVREKAKPCKQVQELWTQGGSIQRVEVKGEWIQEYKRWMGRKINHKIAMAFLVSMSNQPTKTNSTISWQIGNNWKTAIINNRLICIPFGVEEVHWVF